MRVALSRATPATPATPAAGVAGMLNRAAEQSLDRALTERQTAQPLLQWTALHGARGGGAAAGPTVSNRT